MEQQTPGIGRPATTTLPPQACTAASQPREPATATAPGSRIVALTGGGPLPWILINALEARFGPLTILEEDKEPYSVFLRRRVRLLGLAPVIGQVAFAVALKALHKLSDKRKREIITAHGLATEPPAGCPRVPIGSVNAPECREALRRLNPDVVVVIGTRIIRRKTLSCVPAPFINYHAGLNPKYRGMNGAYWARAMGDEENMGATVHLVDEGVDTGAVLAHARVPASERDNITTYPFLLAAAARPLLVEAVEAALEGRLAPYTVPLPSRQWFHPTLGQYVWTGLTRGVW